MYEQSVASANDALNAPARYALIPRPSSTVTTTTTMASSSVSLALVAAVAFAPGLGWLAKGALAAVIGLIHLHLPMLKALWMYRHIRGPAPLPFFGNVFDLAGKDLHKVYQSWEKEYGSVFKAFLGPYVVIVTSEVDMVREVGLRHFSIFTNRPGPPASMTKFQNENERIAQKVSDSDLLPMCRELCVRPMTDNLFVSPLQQNGLVGARDSFWKGMRSTANSIFRNVEVMSGFSPLMKETAEELADRLDKVKEGEPIDIWRAFGDMTLDVVGSTIFGVRFNCVQSKGADAVKAARIIFGSASPFTLSGNPYILLAMMSPSFVHPLIKYVADRFPTKGMKRIQWAAQVMGDTSDEMYRLALQESAPGVADAPAGSNTAAAKADTYEYNGNSFLKLFIQGHNRETGKDLSKDQVVAQAFTFLLAGYETTANTLGYAIYLLAKNKDKERALIDEIDRLGEGKSELPTVEELKSYEYLDAVVKEALRMYGPATLTTRQASKAVEVGKTRLYEGAAVHMTLHGMHWNPEYFPDPDKFLPERFVKGSGLYDKQNHKAHMPFGLGPRMCVASNFALTEAKLALITLFKRYEFDLDPKWEFRTSMGVTLSPQNGISVLVTKR